MTPERSQKQALAAAGHPVGHPKTCWSQPCTNFTQVSSSQPHPHSFILKCSHVQPLPQSFTI
eukprot:scaffold219250_cov17-Tisochrysis_lutea.AAC.2